MVCDACDVVQVYAYTYVEIDRLDRRYSRALKWLALYIETHLLYLPKDPMRLRTNESDLAHNSSIQLQGNGGLEHIR